LREKERNCTRAVTEKREGAEAGGEAIANKKQPE